MVGESQERAFDKQKAEWLFKQSCRFLRGIQKASDLIDFGLPEVGFIGRSNVGKSSLINGLTHRQGLARSSNTPGRTQQLNFFSLNEQLVLVDMPGYGYAQAPKNLVAEWQDLIQFYLKHRLNLKRVYLLVDSRHGIKPNDQDMMTFLDELAVSYQVVLTKADKISPKQAKAVLEQTQQSIGQHGAAYPFVILTSAGNKQGMEELRLEISRFLENGSS